MSGNEDQRADRATQGGQLLDLLGRQHEIYRELRRLARTQRDLIAAEDPTGLLNLLSERQRLIDQLSEINQRLEPLRADWKRVEAMLTGEQRRRASELVEQVGRLFAEILQADEADSKLLSARKAAAGQQLRATAATAQAQAAYRRNAAPAQPGQTRETPVQPAPAQSAQAQPAPVAPAPAQTSVAQPAPTEPARDFPDPDDPEYETIGHCRF